jgi:NACHT domain
MSTQNPDPSAQPPSPEPFFSPMHDEPGYQALSGGKLESRDIHATNVVSGSQYIQQQTIYQGADNSSLGERLDSTVSALSDHLGTQSLFVQQGISSPVSEQQDRALVLKALGKAYWGALDSSLQGVASIRLTVLERINLAPTEEYFSWLLPQKERLLSEKTTILDVYDEMNTGLLILGNPGAGKSTLLYQLAQALIKRAQQDEQHPIPVVLNLSLWATRRLPLEDWIIEQLELRYAIPRKLGQCWQQKERWLLLLDGLDEVALAARPACVEVINTYLSARAHLVSPVVCSRLENYEALPVPLRLTGTVVVQPLTPEQIDAYFNKAGLSLAAVREVVQRNPVLHQLLTTPLMLSVVTLAYRDKAVVDLLQLGSADEQQRHIFASYLERMLPLEGKRSPPSSQKMLHTLVWLAQRMRERSQSILYLEQLQPDWLPSGWTQQAYAWAAVRIPAILIGSCVSLGILQVLSEGFVSPLDNLLLGGVVGGLSTYMPRVKPFRTLRSLLAVAGLLGLFVGLSIALLCYPHAFALDRTLKGICFGIGTILLTLLFACWSLAFHQTTNIAENDTGRRRPIWRRMLTNNALRQGLLVGVLFGGSYGLSTGLIGTDPGYGLSDGLFYALNWGLCGVSISLLLGYIPRIIAPTEILMWSWKRLWSHLKQGEHIRRALLLALVIALCTGLSKWLSWVSDGELSKGLSDGLGIALGSGLSAASGYWLLIGLFQGVSSTSFREHQRAIPNQGIRRSGRNGLVMGLLASIIAAMIGGGAFLVSSVLFGTLSSWPNLLSVGPSSWLGIGGDYICLLTICTDFSVVLNIGWQTGLVVGLLVTLFMGGLAWWRHWVLRFLLCCNGTLSWHIVSLLDEAAHRTLLHKEGGGYRFAHDLFRNYLATLEPLSIRGTVAQGVPQVDSTFGEEIASPSAPCRRVGFDQEKRKATLLNVVLLLIALASGVSIFGGVHQNIQDVNDASAVATTQIVSQDATATAQPKANSTAEALANALPIAYPPHNQFPVLSDSLEDIDSQGDNEDVSTSNGFCKLIINMNSGIQESCSAAKKFTNFVYEVQMKIIKGDGGGIAFRSDSTNLQFYYFAINQHGSYSVHAVISSGYDVVLAHGFSSAIHEGPKQTNLVAAVVRGQIIELYVNLKRVAVVGCSIFTHGEIGLIVTEVRHRTEVIFQNAKVWKL